MAFLEDIKQGGMQAGKGLVDVLEAIASPVTGIAQQLELPKLAAQLAAQEGNPIPLQMMQQQQQQALMQQLLQQQMQGMQQPQQDMQLQMAVASKDFQGASKRVNQLKNTENLITSVQKNKALPQESQTFIVDFLKSGGSPNTAATLVQQEMSAARKQPEKELITKGRELTIKGKEAALKAQEEQKGGTVAKIASIIDRQISQGLIKNLDQLKASIKAELRGTQEERETAAEELASFWTTKKPTFFGLIDKKEFTGQPRTKQEPEIMISPSTGRKFIKNSDGTYTEIK